VLNLWMPALRERAGDALELARLFAARLAHQYRLPEKRLHPEAVAFIEDYSWPGNVRELENVIHRDFLMNDDPELRCKEARSKLTAATTLDDAGSSRQFQAAKARAIAEFERRYVMELLARAGGNITQAARLAGKDRSAFGKLVRKYA